MVQLLVEGPAGARRAACRSVAGHVLATWQMVEAELERSALRRMLCWAGAASHKAQESPECKLGPMPKNSIALAVVGAAPSMRAALDEYRFSSSFRAFTTMGRRLRRRLPRSSLGDCLGQLLCQNLWERPCRLLESWRAVAMVPSVSKLYELQPRLWPLQAAVVGFRPGQQPLGVMLARASESTAILLCHIDSKAFQERGRSETLAAGYVQKRMRGGCNAHIGLVRRHLFRGIRGAGKWDRRPRPCGATFSRFAGDWQLLRRGREYTFSAKSANG